MIRRPPGVQQGAPSRWPRIGITLADVRAAFAAAGPSGPPEPTMPLGQGVAGQGDAGQGDGSRGDSYARPGPLRSAAVLVAVFEEEDRARVLLTRRSAELRSHTGEVAFPGGRMDPGEAALDAALREAVEEVGLDPAQSEVLGELTPLTTWSSTARITPFVAALPGRPELRPNPAEVEEAFDVALSDLLTDDVYREELWPLEGQMRSVFVFELEEDTVWGATARMLHELLDRVVPYAQLRTNSID